MCCLFDVIPEPYTGQPRFFISHTWSRRLNNLLALLQSRFVEGKDDDVLLWLDIVAINQHPYEDKGCLLQADVASLASVVQATEQTLFCLDAQCVVLTRIWCLYEVSVCQMVAGLVWKVVWQVASTIATISPISTILTTLFSTFSCC